jgi:nitric oxide reductase subunit C
MIRWCLVSAIVVLCTNAAWADDGAALYEKKCKVCHSIGGVGGPKKDLGGALDDVGTKRDEAWLRAYFKDPKSKIENAKMPKLPLSDADWDALVKYMLTLKGSSPK